MYLALLRKGMKTGADKVQVLKVLNVMAFIEPLEAKSRGREDQAGLRTGLARVLCELGVEALKVTEDVSDSVSAWGFLGVADWVLK